MIEFIKLVRHTATLELVMRLAKFSTYYDRVMKEKWDQATKQVVRRVRGGDYITQAGVSSAVASFTWPKHLLNKN